MISEELFGGNPGYEVGYGIAGVVGAIAATG